jgi:hypothetical protein
MDQVHTGWSMGPRFPKRQPLKSWSKTEILKGEGVSDLLIWIIHDEMNGGD